MTGEENEDVTSELKGVKLFIKRGDKEFADGIFGHVKYLSHRDTKEERLGSSVVRSLPLRSLRIAVTLQYSVGNMFGKYP